jgi:hypothetical protein
VDRYTPPGSEDWLVDTAAINDSTKPFETAVQSPHYNDGKMVIVELYDTKDEAQKGHDKWVNKMTAKNPPKSLKDVSTSGIVRFANALGADFNETHERKT